MKKKQKFSLCYLDKDNLIFICSVKKDRNGIEFENYSKALKTFKNNFPDLVIIPVTQEEFINSLKNIEVYYSIYQQLKDTQEELNFLVKKIFLKYKIIDIKDKLLLSLNLSNKKSIPTSLKRKVILIEKNIKKEFEINDIFMKLNCKS